MHEFDTVIGLEIHVQLKTSTKLFCADQTEFGVDPNTQISEVSLGYPGTLPVLNEKAVELAVRAGLATDSKIATTMFFDRKNYFYPDLPKGYQLTQDREPVARGGSIKIKLKDGSTKDIELTKIHLEEDAGKSIHTDSQTHSHIDFNRAGMPLIEIVTEPVITSAEEAAATVSTVRRLVRYLEIGDGNMEQGSLRCDVNVSLKAAGSKTLGNKVEIKNLNSIRFVQRAIEFEIKRQAELLKRGETVESETRLYDSDKNLTTGMRLKETLNDYRYFPDPDLPTVELGEQTIQEIERNMPATPWEVEERLKSEFDLSDYDAGVIVDDKAIAEYYLNIIEHTENYKSAANWVMGPVKGYLNEEDISIEQFSIAAKDLAHLINHVESETISNHIASKFIFPELLNSKGSLEELIEEYSKEDANKEEDLTLVLSKLIEEYPEEWAEFKNGKKKLIGMFVGKAMKMTDGKADPTVLRELLLKNIG